MAQASSSVGARVVGHRLSGVRAVDRGHRRM